MEPNALTSTTGDKITIFTTKGWTWPHGVEANERECRIGYSLPFIIAASEDPNDFEKIQKLLGISFKVSLLDNRKRPSRSCLELKRERWEPFESGKVPEFYYRLLNYPLIFRASVHIAEEFLTLPFAAMVRATELLEIPQRWRGCFRELEPSEQRLFGDDHFRSRLHHRLLKDVDLPPFLSDNDETPPSSRATTPLPSDDDESPVQASNGPSSPCADRPTEGVPSSARSSFSEADECPISGNLAPFRQKASSTSGDTGSTFREYLWRMERLEPKCEDGVARKGRRDDSSLQHETSQYTNMLAALSKEDIEIRQSPDAKSEDVFAGHDDGNPLKREMDRCAKLLAAVARKDFETLQGLDPDQQEEFVASKTRSYQGLGRDIESSAD